MNPNETLKTIIGRLYELRGRLRSDRLVDPDDAIQEVVLGLLNRTSPPSIGAAWVNAYAFRAGLLSMANARRKAGRYDQAIHRFKASLEVDRTSFRQESPLEAATAQELRERIAEAMNQLPLDQRNEVIRHFFKAELPGAVNSTTRPERDRLRSRALRRLGVLLGDLRPQPSRRDRASNAVPPDSHQENDPSCGNASKNSRCGPEAA